MRRARIEYVASGSAISGTVTFPGGPAQPFTSAAELERCLGQGAQALLLVRSPEPASIAGQDDLARLSETELEIVNRAVAGDSNREIADALFYSVKSVEAYLTRIYRRLGIEGRDGLAAATEDLEPSEADRALVLGGAGAPAASTAPAIKTVVVELYVA
jgi:DNA-binding CsgD family transcriptional regulator